MVHSKEKRIKSERYVLRIDKDTAEAIKTSKIDIPEMMREYLNFILNTKKKK